MLKLNPIPYLLALATVTNIGSIVTISGNPQNILIGSFSQIAYLDVALVLTSVALMINHLNYSALGVLFVLVCIKPIHSFLSVALASRETYRSKLTQPI
ncbi:SLC13 family permease [Rivularia sp. UHCC 0363]|uniref:SLC13 family permease n=1 Tax=Rivularia sp. UHCC 0363 TaxID=3110244 RepID=UPI003A5989BB